MRWFALPLVCALLTLASAAEASIIGSSWSCSGSGAFGSFQQSWGTTATAGTYWANNSATQQSLAAGVMTTSFSTNSPTDPTLLHGDTITNDTGLSWTGYLITETITTPVALTSYAISSPTVTNPGDWTSTITAPLAGGYSNGQYVYTGSIDYQGGTSVSNGGQLAYNYTVSFQGSQTYSESVQATPVAAAVPEPSTLALLAVGLLGLVGVRRRLCARAS